MQHFQWMNEPSFWQVSEFGLKISADPKTDFWQKTHYGFVRDSGHFYYRWITGSFTAKVKISGQYRHLYDQAGLMIRQDEQNWIKTGIEYVHGQQQVSAVVTRGFSDWSVAPYLDNPSSIWIRVKREGDFVEISYSTEDDGYQLLRLAYMKPSDRVMLGFMAAAPDGEGFDVVFSDFQFNAI